MRLKTPTLLTGILMLAVFVQGIAQVINQGPKADAPLSEARRLSQLETQLENVRQELEIPAYSATIVRDQKVIWAKGFGFADVENKIPATEHTPYHLASLTKTFASTILMQLVQEGRIRLDDPVTKYGITLESDGVIRVKQEDAN